MGTTIQVNSADITLYIQSCFLFVHLL
uniref:Uncharacterized protein n=1 Tax=Anguilla anguilla TaxID=7936 RepID=A0A0E9PN48_ANGAN